MSGYHQKQPPIEMLQVVDLYNNIGVWHICVSSAGFVIVISSQPKRSRAWPRITSGILSLRILNLCVCTHAVLIALPCYAVHHLQ